ncbi:hypothetical protein POM88_049673 [Heracleum sosnowskyi]|uniref:Uncharacterized protein n=1 Tax=Heracleum sosnowskyi TaxID=360622 RepID=A0AAD8M1S4_9APIA|nr:hypothetical protein POM88_049673 [Heracleum sosnowskyi]
MALIKFDEIASFSLPGAFNSCLIPVENKERLKKAHKYTEIYARLRHRVAFVYDGQVVLDTPLLLKNDRSCKIFSIKPIAVSASEEVRIVVKGSNIVGSNTRFLCALEGKYLVQEDSSSLIDGAASFTDNEEEIQSRSFLSSIPDVIGRGFIEVTLLPSLFLCSQHVQSFSFLICNLWSEHLNLLVRVIGALYL